MARKKGKVWRYTETQRDEILETARQENLSAAEVAKRFGVPPWIYSSWLGPARGLPVAAERDGKEPRSSDNSSPAEDHATALGAASLRRRVGRYTNEEREHVLAVARNEGLTADQVWQRFGVAQKVFRRWRGPVGSGRRPTAVPNAPLSTVPDAAPSAVHVGGLDGVREALRTELRRLLVPLLREEVAAAVREALGAPSAEVSESRRAVAPLATGARPSLRSPNGPVGRRGKASSR